MKKIVLFLSLVLSFKTSALAETTFQKNGWDYSISGDAFEGKQSFLVYKVTESGAIALRCDQPGPNSLYITIMTDKEIGGESKMEGFYKARFRLDNLTIIEGTVFAKSNLASWFKTQQIKEIFAEADSNSIFYFQTNSIAEGENANAIIPLVGVEEAFSWIEEKCES